MCAPGCTSFGLESMIFPERNMAPFHFLGTPLGIVWPISPVIIFIILSMMTLHGSAWFLMPITM